ncbi:hypothetical protein AcV5_008309 [Taiwanofungus camphoratus]|nr:hypothetical protein AcV5_008309 [Antrodia cinnamomea]KAI0955712.1 hypothetical protein AcV7_006301 [Antrodia cinnamomea]
MDSLVSLKVAFQFSPCFLADFQCGNELDLLARFGIDVDYTKYIPCASKYQIRNVYVTDQREGTTRTRKF